MTILHDRRAALGLLSGLAAAPFAARAQGATPGVTASEIKIGQTFATSGAASSLGTIARAEAAYFAKINDDGGVAGRKLNLVSLDDGYSPPRTLEQTRRLVEQEGVAFIYGSLGTASNLAIARYLNTRKIPQLLIATGSAEFTDPDKYPWTLGWQTNNVTEARIFAKYLLAEKPDAKIGVLYQNDDYGKGFIAGLKEALGPKAGQMMVATASYETTDATVDSQILSLKASGANVLVNASIPKFAAQAIRASFDSGWKPLQLLGSVSSSVGQTLQPAGLDKATGIMSAQFYKDPTDRTWDDDPGMKDWRAFMAKYYPAGDVTDANNVYAYSKAYTMVEILRRCGGDFSRDSIMRQALGLDGLEVPTLLPGVRLNTSPRNFTPIRQMQMLRFDGARWALVGGVLSE